MNKLTTKGIEFKEHNGKPKINLYKKCMATIGTMKVKGINIHISESKVNSIRTFEPRKYMMSLRQDGINNGDYKMTQISLTEDELILIRDSINSLLSYGK